MGYVLEHSGESERLERQAKQKGYSLIDELRGINFVDVENVLDAGCGNGLLSRYLKEKFPKLKTSGCDFSELRLNQADKLNQELGFNDIDLYVENLEGTSFQDNFFQKIISRYVFEHLQNPQIVAKELYRILAPNGKLHVIDFDGMFLNVYNGDQRLENMLNQIKNSISFDLFIGRKLPYIFNQAGFKNIRWHMECITFQADEKQEELINASDRLAFAYPVLLEIFKTSQKVMEFNERYLEAFKNHSSVIFHNKIIIEGQK